MGGTDGLVVTFGADSGSLDGTRVRHATTYVDSRDDIVTDDDFDRMRAWLDCLATYDGISLGSLIDSPFIPLFGEQLLRQFHLVSAVVDTESPDFVDVNTRDRAVYEWFETGSAHVHPGVVTAVCDHRDIPVNVEVRRSVTTVKDRGFRLAGPFALRWADRATESYNRFRTGFSPAESDVLIYLMNVKNLDVIGPVIQELRDRGKSPVIVYHAHGFFDVGTEEFERLEELDVPVRRFESYQSKEVYASERQARSQLREEWATLRNDLEEQAQFRLDGIEMWPALADRFWLAYTVQFPRIVRYIETARRVFSQVDPDVLFVKGDGPIPNRTFVRVANERDVPSLILQHGKGQSTRRFAIESRHVAVWGELGAGFYEQMGHPSDEITITGAPHFDELQKRTFDESDIRHRVGIPAGTKPIMLASQPYSQEVREQILDAVVESVIDREDVTLLLRPHPREDVELFEDVTERSDVSAVLVPDADIHELIAVSDVVCSIDSTVLFEAGLLETPAFVLNFTGRAIQDFWASEGYHLVEDVTTLSGDIQQVLDDPDFRESVLESQPGFERRYAMNGDGRATERVVDLLLEWTE